MLLTVAPDFYVQYSYDSLYTQREIYLPFFINFFFCLIQLDPFLNLVDDHKLKAVNSDQLKVAYGCEKDDASALDTLSNIALSTEHSRGTLVYEIVKSLEDMCNVSVPSHNLPTKLLYPSLPFIFW